MAERLLPVHFCGRCCRIEVFPIDICLYEGRTRLKNPSKGFEINRKIVELITQKTPIDGKGEFYWSRGYSLDPDNVSIYFVNVKKKISSIIIVGWFGHPRMPTFRILD